ncbi:MAG: 6-phosphofructokinase [Bacteriovoracaceae bacterium]|jgi:6-phosphofructokinase 1|nr:6-phosphofructokinase [Halobacteriovoraceae bacterium]MDP7319128.1 6-phosphofructokinase [Bacteriovoracaceae bacterium]|tara:strand:- start:293 stop:1279 length:987 start_codon:yes stop_codon:yes gene_type:complete
MTKKKQIKTIALLTSGGDSPGMNCVIRSITRTAIGQGIKVYGIQRGYAGLLNNQFVELNASSVGNIIQRGGTILHSSRCPEFKEKHNREKAAQILDDRGVDALIVIGGDGSFKGALALEQEQNIPVIGIPGTIDNDISGTEYTIGFDTAVQTAIEAVDKIRDTAASNDRTFLIEVMGANSSSIALKVGVCTGAENVLLSHQKVDYEKIANAIRRGERRGKNSSIIIVAEGPKPGRSYDISHVLEDLHHISSRVCILGHIQRGGSPTANDRFYGSLMGQMSIQALLKGKHRHAIVVRNDHAECVPLTDCSEKSDHAMKEFVGIAEELSI